MANSPPFPVISWPTPPTGPRGRYQPETAGPSLLEPPVLDAIVEEIPEKGVYIEVGTWGGASAALIADRRPQVQIISVDSFVSDRARLLWLLNRRPNMRLFDGPGHCFWGMAGNCRADTIYVDGDHTEAGTTLDLREACRVIRPGRPILVHDYTNHNYPGVKTAVDRFCAATGWRITKQVASMVVLRREVSP